MLLACAAGSAIAAEAASDIQAVPDTIAPILTHGTRDTRDNAVAAPEAASGFQARPQARGARFMVATANPLATNAAFDVLDEGGSAVDAAIAAQMMLTLVEPQSSGIGGGAFLVAYDAAPNSVVAWDGRETAPAAADEHLFLDKHGEPLPFFSAVVGGLAVGVPGVVRMLEAAHREHGRLPWARLLQPAIERATQGFAVSPRLHALIKMDPFLRDDPVAAAYFHDGQDQPIAIGTVLRNPQLARTLQTLAEQGADALYTGPLAEQIVAKVRSHPRNPGLMTLDDLGAYRPVRREPICTDWLRWVVCGMPPPSSGGIAVAQMLGILEATRFNGLTGGSTQLDVAGVHLFSEAGRLAYADRDRFVADTDFVPLPTGLLDPDYLKRRAAQIHDESMGTADAGRPAPRTYPERGTSQVSVVDGQGNAASLTTSIENAFGSRQMVAGFMLNNELTDFSFSAARPARATTLSPQPVANRPQPGKRPRSSMAPTLVFERTESGGSDGSDRGLLKMVTGSPGGAAIINYVTKALVATLQDGLDPLAAIALPNIGSRNGPTELERGRVTPELVEALRKRGHETRLTVQTSGIQSVVRHCEPATPAAKPESCGWIGAADPRREGSARGR